MTTPPIHPKKKKPGAALAALDRRAGQWRLAVARPGGSVERDTLQEADLVNLGERLARAGVARLVRVAPACECLAKLEAAPEAQGEELAAAVALVADAALPEDVPAHRRAAGLVGGEGADARVLAAAWLARENAPGPRIKLDGIEEVWVAEPAAHLAFATAETGAILAWDRELGSVFAASLDAAKPRARCIRLDGADEAAWARSLAAAADSVGLRDARPGDKPADLAQGLVSRGPLFTGGWAAVPAQALAGEFGPVLGALRLASIDSPLVGMRRTADDGREPAPVRAARWVSAPRRASLLIAAGLAVCLLAPMTFAWARYAVVKAKLDSIGAAADARDSLKKEAALYRQMDLSRWPMTKLLADVANATPIHVVIESISLEHEGNQGLMLKGRADSAEILSTLQKNLNQTGILSSVQVSSVAADGSGVTFTLQAKVVSAKTPSKVLEDFGKKNLATRLYVDGAASPSTALAHHEDGGDLPAGDEDMTDPPSGEREASAPSAGDGGGRSNGGNRGNNGGGSRRGGSPRTLRGESATSGETTKAPAPKAFEVPPPITDAAIAALDKDGAMKQWTTRRLAAQNSATPPEDKSRLEDEVKKLEAKWKGGGS